MKNLCVIASIAVLGVGFAAASDDWTGLWRVSRFYENSLDAVYHLRISDEPGDRVTIYTDDMRPMINQRVEFDGNRLEVQVANSATQPLPLLFKLNRKGANLTGEWLFSQFQLEQPLEGKALGFLVLPDSDWDPWRFIERHRQDRTIDLLGLLREKAPLRTFARFQSFWTEEVEPDFYVLVQQWLYGDGRRPEQTKREALRTLHDFLTGSHPSLALAEKFPGLAQKTMDIARQRFEEQTPVYLISSFGPEPVSETLLWTRVPTPEDEETCACKLDLRERFVAFNPSKLSSSEAGPAFLLKEMLRETLWNRPALALAVESFRQGLSFRLAWVETGREPPALGSGILSVMREQFADLLMAEPVGHFPHSLQEQALAVSLGLTLGTDLVGALLADRPLTEALKLSDVDAMQAWRDYLGVKSGPPKARASRR